MLIAFCFNDVQLLQFHVVSAPGQFYTARSINTLCIVFIVLY